MPPRHLLIVDDEDDIREVASLSLEMTCGWTVSMASSGAQGLESARTLQPDAILLDVMMPEMDGPSTLRLLQSSDATRNIPVIFLTAKVQGADRRKFLQLGVQGIIAKPFDPLTLAKQISETLQWTNES
jgi:CheY-like chemotaxis protein